MSQTSHPVLLRWSRALLLAVVALVTGGLAHTSAGGLMPGTWALVTLLLASTTTAAMLLTGPASRLKVVLLVVGGQAAIHTALTALAGHAGAGRAPAPPPLLATPARGRSGSLYDQVMPTTRPAELRTPDWILHLTDDLTGPHALMALAHVAAAALVGLWLAAGEQALWSLLLVALRPVLPGAPVIPLLPRLAVGPQTVVRPMFALPRAFPRRGPPCSCAL